MAYKRIIKENIWQNYSDIKLRIDACTNLNELFVLWNSTQKTEPEDNYKKYRNGDVLIDSFSRDGFVCEDMFDKETGILFVSKEPNWSRDKNAEIKINNEFWLKDVVCNQKWSESLFSKRLSLLANFYYSKELANKNHGVLKKCAFINLNKRGGYSSSWWKTIKLYTDLYSDFIAKEIQLINPSLIVCCGKGLKWYLEEFVIDKNQYGVIEVAHPSYYFVSDAKYIEQFTKQMETL